MRPNSIELLNKFQSATFELVADYVRATGHLPECPAETLPGVVGHLGWGLKFTPMPADRWAECDRIQRQIRIAKDLAERLEVPTQARRVAHALIAHELAHAVLHSDYPRSRHIPKRWEWEARLWTKAFLTPWRLLVNRPELGGLRNNMLPMRKRWERVHDLAEAFQVSTSFMVASLCSYGVLERCGEGIQAPYQVLVVPARSWRQSA